MTSQEEKQNRVEYLEKQAANARQLQYNASEMRDARGVFRIEHVLLNLYREIDALLAS